MFGEKAEKAQAQAVVLASHEHGHSTRGAQGVDWEHRTYILEIRPANGTPFRVETTAKVPVRTGPEVGDLIGVSYEVKNHEVHQVKIQIEGDPKYDPLMVRERRRLENAAKDAALLSGMSAGPGYDPDDEPRWAVPVLCPSCGVKVDQSKAPFEESPTCGSCGQPLPCEAP
jgi:hypothetical protein